MSNGTNSFIFHPLSGLESINPCLAFTILQTIKGSIVSATRSVYNLQGHILQAFPNSLKNQTCLLCERFYVLYFRQIISIPLGLFERLQCNFLSSNNYLIINHLLLPFPFETLAATYIAIHTVSTFIVQPLFHQHG